jgi:hemerythrin superfamily protein
MNAITLLKEDHKNVKALFKKFEGLGENANSEKKKVVERIIKELAMHAAIEEQLLYPAARKVVPAAEDNVLEALEEHHIVKWTLNELEDMSPDEERFDAKVSVLMESVRHHIEEEEEDLFPKLRNALSRKQLDALGASLEAAKKGAPTHPHPSAPDSPPGNTFSVPGAALLDRALDSVVDGVTGAGRAIVKTVKDATDMSPSPAQKKRGNAGAKGGKAGAKGGKAGAKGGKAAAKRGKAAPKRGKAAPKRGKAASASRARA